MVLVSVENMTSKFGSEREGVGGAGCGASLSGRFLERVIRGGELFWLI